MGPEGSPHAVVDPELRVIGAQVGSPILLKTALYIMFYVYIIDNIWH
jgi:hypothetical protein